jgi:hypothetical protein
MLFEDVICVLCLLYMYGLLWACFVILGARIYSVGEFDGGPMQSTYTEDRLADMALMGPVRLPSDNKMSR